MANLTVDASGGERGTFVHVYGDGFKNGEVVMFYFNGYWSTTLDADGAGEFDGYVDVPNGCPVGANVVACVGTYSGEEASSGGFTVS